MNAGGGIGNLPMRRRAVYLDLVLGIGDLTAREPLLELSQRRFRHAERRRRESKYQDRYGRALVKGRVVRCRPRRLAGNDARQREIAVLRDVYVVGDNAAAPRSSQPNDVPVIADHDVA